MTRTLLAAIAAIVLASSPSQSQTVPDLDGDGFPLGPDCDDTRPAVNPGHPDVMDGLDNNCDGVADGYAPGYPLADGDGDGYSPLAQGPSKDCDDSDESVRPYRRHPVLPHLYEYVGCTQLGDVDDDGFTVAEGDCDDQDPTVHPGGPNPPYLWQGQCVMGYPTGNGDGDGDGYTVAQGDCDDADDSIHPGAPDKTQDGIDQNCDGSDATVAVVGTSGSGTIEFGASNIVTPIGGAGGSQAGGNVIVPTGGSGGGYTNPVTVGGLTVGGGAGANATYSGSGGSAYQQPSGPLYGGSGAGLQVAPAGPLYRQQRPRSRAR